MIIEQALRTCLRSRRRFSSTEAAIKAIRMIATLKPMDWPTVSRNTGFSEHVLPGLVNQCGCSVKVIEWIRGRDWEINVQNLNRVITKYSMEGNDDRKANQDEWQLYWGAWFLESRIPLPPKHNKRHFSKQ